MAVCEMFLGWNSFCGHHNWLFLAETLRQASCSFCHLSVVMSDIYSLTCYYTDAWFVYEYRGVDLE